MALITLRNISLGSGKDALYENANLIVEPRQRICIIGRNGAGKSTLFKLIQGSIMPDQGEVERQQNLLITQLEQDIPTHLRGTVFDVVASGLAQSGSLLIEYEATLQLMEHDYSPELLEKLQTLQQAMETKQAWSLKNNIDTILSKMDLSPQLRVEQLSGGLIRRVLLAKALVADPDILLLDEPTNHLDIEAIIWLEGFLLNYPKTIIFITHDKQFLQHLATQIVEIDQGQLITWQGDYQSFLQFKETKMAADARANDLFDKKLAEEERWIRQGIKARRTRNEGRVRALKQLRFERQQRRDDLGTVQLHQQEMVKSGKLVFVAEDVSYQLHDKTIINHFSTIIARGDKIGIIGPNGCGKSTLLQLLLGKLTPTSGTVNQGSNLTVSYFDQRREQLDETKTVQENIYDGGDFLTIGDNKIHIMTYLSNFLFTPQRARTPTRFLSGGERSRLLLARLFTKPSNVLILDEPTNDLDMETLELLEEYLLNYAGTVLLVSHDRDFLNNVVTATLVFEGDGNITEYQGGYDDYKLTKSNPTPMKSNTLTEPTTKKTEASLNKLKLSFKEKQELAQLPNKIEQLEAEQTQLRQAMLAADFYKKTKAELAEHHTRLTAIETGLELAYQRWTELEQKQ
jgi:ATP-binding cassette subfamily F protein uup